MKRSNSLTGSEQHQPRAFGTSAWGCPVDLRAKHFKFLYPQFPMENSPAATKADIQLLIKRFDRLEANIQSNTSELNRLSMNFERSVVNVQQRFDRVDRRLQYNHQSIDNVIELIGNQEASWSSRFERLEKRVTALEPPTP